MSPKKPKTRDLVVTDTMARCLIYLTPEPTKRSRPSGRTGSQVCPYNDQTYDGLLKRGLIARVGNDWSLTEMGKRWLKENEVVWGFARTADERRALSALRKTP